MEDNLELPDVAGRWCIDTRISDLSLDVVEVTLILKTGVNTFTEMCSVVLGSTTVEELNEALEDSAQRLALRSEMFTRLNTLCNQFPLQFKEV